MPAAVAPLPGVSHSITPTRNPASANSKAHAVPTIPAPTTRTSKDSTIVNPPLERVTLVEYQTTSQRDKRFSSNAGIEMIAFESVGGLKTTANDTFLHPYFTRLQLTICRQTGHLRAGSRTTGRT